MSVLPDIGNEECIIEMVIEHDRGAAEYSISIKTHSEFTISGSAQVQVGALTGLVC